MRAPGSPRIAWQNVPETVRSQVAEALNARVVEALDQDGGFSPGCAARLLTADGRRVFVKGVSAELNRDSARLHRAEARALASMPAGLPIARLLDTVDADGWVVLCLEHVEGRPPQTPWRPADLTATMGALERVSTVRAPLSLPAIQDVAGLDGWRAIAADANGIDPLLLGRLTELAAESARVRAMIAGDRIVHWDIRADNVLVRADGNAVVVDWSHAARGAGWLDSLLLALDCAVQGGPNADDVLAAARPVTDAAPEALRCVVAALVGYFADHARRPAPPGLPTVRGWQRHCASSTLDWYDTSRIWNGAH